MRIDTEELVSRTVAGLLALLIFTGALLALDAAGLDVSLPVEVQSVSGEAAPVTPATDGTPPALPEDALPPAPLPETGPNSPDNAPGAGP